MSRHLFRYASILVVLVILLTSCSTAGAPPAAEAPAAEAPAAAQPAAPAAGASAEIPDVPRNRTLIMAGLGGEHFGGFTDVDLFNDYVPGISRSGFTQACTEGLFYYNMTGDEFIPWLAEGYEFNEDYTEVLLTLREGVEWSDGEPFTANDIVFSINMLLTHPELADAGQIIDTVASAEVIDDLNLRITLTGPNPRFVFDVLTFHADLGVPLATPEHIFGEVEDVSTFKNYDPERGLPLCTGPYKLVASNVQQKIWDVREDWWGAKTGFRELPRVQRLIFLPGMDENTMVQMIINNEIDLAFSFTATNWELAKAQNAALTTHSDQPPYGFLDWWPMGLGFNNTVPPFDDPEIRWAISYSIDRDEIINFAFKGTTTATRLPYPGFPGIQPFIESVDDLLQQYNTTEFNPAKTEEIMTSKGYEKDSEGFWTKDGNRITFEIITFPQHPSATPQVPIVTEQLRRAGFDASFLLPADFATRIQTGQAVAFLWGHGGSMNDPYATMDLYHIRHVKPTGEAIPFTNLYRWSNQEFSAIVDQMRALESDDPQLVELFHQAMEIWLPNLPDITLTETVILLPRNTTYWTNWPSPENPYVHEGFWHRTAMLLWVALEPTQ
jgi:peptide/nickel transport system substrate-binding protein